MSGFTHHRDAVGLQSVTGAWAICCVMRFLHLQAARVHIHDPGYFAQANDLSISGCMQRDISRKTAACDVSHIE